MNAIEPPTDMAVVERVLGGDRAAFELLMRRYNQRLFRLARSIVRDDGEAEDVVQETYLRAYKSLSQFEGRSQFSTWLTKIAFHEALARQRRQKRTQLVDFSDAETASMQPLTTEPPAEQHVSSKELDAMLGQAVDGLPDDLRTVFALRMIEGLDTAETAACLELTQANVKIRVHRARALLRAHIDQQIGTSVRQLYQFGGSRCDRIVAAVLIALEHL